MCIVFLHSDPLCQNGYKLIIAANRDENLLRPSKEADFMFDNSDVLCGIDLKLGVEGGTWLGVTKTGKFGFLTIYLTSEAKGEGASRGFIVKDYLYSDMCVNDYIHKCLVKKRFRPFSFIGGQLTSEDIELCYYSNCDEASPIRLENGLFTLACTSLGTQWKKVALGTDIFASAVRNPSQNPAQLTDFLITKLLSNSTNLYPDPLVSKQNKSNFSDAFLQSYCSIMMTGLLKYGTRSQTVVLVNKNNRMFFTENNMIKDECGIWTWKRKTYNFSLNL